ncbi:MAG: biotin--[acetyl-CoA-carboxylase] ligase [Candidatus Izemoplasmatales bacterium]|jgi:BirA family biotin operon repressor/biotin-[acetyl-CoA-carboxylase] ligase|nr:biotin--[acetyl-CoA-carboxylase] ligase [Candidatus Izemoplasmatales bacterium]MDD4354516.1 biotin--[acetyl-CoA-carboxylase] ligase [Candidatus Izemoplasmatales bacterium]MDD4987801.1 biotin--[acetyl-CoA-carboxylase] ligase [Candidatus Izemoplasmatales bacterium]MDD5602281.1 biotin--[acetyl-CoA-carboxylase] ligase [Candidatus Izemoplasmatales bacterium]
MQSFNPEIKTFSTLDSTNDYLKQNYLFLPDHTICQALAQTKGRGRRGTSWESEAGKNLLFSVLFKEYLDPIQLMRLAGSTLLEILAEKEIQAIFKMPNDIWVNGKKIAGLLIESIYGETCEATILGIGLNVNQRSFVTQNATSVWLETNTETKIEDWLARFLKEFINEKRITGHNRFDQKIGNF